MYAYIDIILSYKSWPSGSGRCFKNFVYSTICLAVLMHMVHQTQAHTSKQSNLFWVNMESKHPCDGVPLLFSELSDAHRHRKIAIVGRGGQIIGEEIWGEYF